MNLRKILSSLVSVLPIVLIIIIFLLPLWKNGLIVGGDWNFPYTNGQLKEFSNVASSIWSNREIPTGTQISHQNIYPINLLASIWAAIGFDGTSFQKATLSLTIIGIYWFSYILFLRFTKNKTASRIGALSYLMSPVVFNYINMGWNYVLLFLALLPLFTIYAIDYFQLGRIKRVLMLGFICAIGFTQSQSIVWFPIAYFLIFLYQIKRDKLIKQIMKLVSGLFSMAAVVLTINAPWIITSLKYMDSSFTTTSNIDINRFSVVFSLLNSIRDWGSLYNLQFEMAQPVMLTIFTLMPLFLLIYFTAINKNGTQQKYFYFAISLILIAPLIYLFRVNIAQIPLSSIIRDNSRFLVLTSFGLSIGIALSINAIKNKTLLILITICLLLSVFPYISGRLYKANHSYSDRDSRLRILDIPMNNYDKNLEKYSDQLNVFFPAGGTIKTKNNTQYKEAYWEISDTQSSFSPSSAGIYFSDKSNPLVKNFVKTLTETKDDITSTKDFLSIYGINNIFNRSNLSSFIDLYPINFKKNTFCSKTDNQDTDWSVTEICHFDYVYPIIYSSVTPIYSTDPITNFIGKKNTSDEKIALIGCPNDIKGIGSQCGPKTPFKLSSKNPNIKMTKISDTKYLVDVSDISGSFILIFNKTFHQGWRIINTQNNPQNYEHILINQLVNGWVVEPTIDQSESHLIIEFYPQEIYAEIFPFSVIALLSLPICILFKMKKDNDKNNEK